VSYFLHFSGYLSFRGVLRLRVIITVSSRKLIDLGAIEFRVQTNVARFAGHVSSGNDQKIH